jgi:hypothetical protein
MAKYSELRKKLKIEVTKPERFDLAHLTHTYKIATMEFLITLRNRQLNTLLRYLKIRLKSLIFKDICL